MQRVFSILAFGLLMLCDGARAASAPDYARLYAAHDFFALRVTLATDKTDSDQVQFYRAAVLTAFNQPAAASRIIDGLLAKNMDTTLMPDLMDMRMHNARQLSDYAGALDADRTLIDIYERSGNAARLVDLRNLGKLLGALNGVPPQQVTRQGASHIILAPDGQGGYCIPVTVGTDDPCYLLDSGANYSILIRSEAQRLHLNILPAGMEIGTSTGAKVTADVAVAPLLLLGNLRYQNVVFLVVPDAAFTFKDFQIRGILGYQVFAGMGAVTARQGSVIDVPASVPAAPVDDIALDGNDMLTEVTVNGHGLLCRLDTGADHTVFYEPYYELYKPDVDKNGIAQVAHTGGAGGIRTFKSYVLPQLGMTLAGKKLTLDKVSVYTESVIPQDYIMCNLGRDALKSFKSYTINLQSMALTLH
jgi:hypothetical protein